MKTVVIIACGIMMLCSDMINAAPRTGITKPAVYRDGDVPQVLDDEARDHMLLMSGMQILAAIGNMVAHGDFTEARKFIPALIAAITQFASVVTRNVEHIQDYDEYIQHIAKHVMRAYMAAMANTK